MKLQTKEDEMEDYLQLEITARAHDGRQTLATDSRRSRQTAEARDRRQTLTNTANALY